MSTPLACPSCGGGVAAVEIELVRLLERHSRPPLPHSTLDLDEWVAYVVDWHHRYIYEAVPVLYSSLQMVTTGHGARHPELRSILDSVRRLGSELINHLSKEDHILFPFLVGMASARRTDGALPASPFGTIYHPIRAMEREHDKVSEQMALVVSASDGFRVPRDACELWRRCYAELDWFEHDLEAHVRVENDILFPQSLELERQLSCGMHAPGRTVPLHPEVHLSKTQPTIASGEALNLRELLTPTPHGIASRVLAKAAGGSVTLFAFDAGQELSEHTAPFDALALVLEGALVLTVGGSPVRAVPGTLVLMPAHVPHAVEAPEPARMLLVMVRDRQE
jgi:iron-sulfur cluster repair di-iron protein